MRNRQGLNEVEVQPGLEAEGGQKTLSLRMPAGAAAKGNGSVTPGNKQRTADEAFEMAMKTMASGGAGAFSLSTLTPLPTEPFLYSGLDPQWHLASPEQRPDHADTNNLVTQNMLDWPEFAQSWCSWVAAS